MQQAGRELTSVDLRVVTNDKQDFLGSTGQTGDGRVFRYCKIGAVSIPAGTVVATPYTTNFVGLSVASDTSNLIASQIYEIKVQLNGTAVALNDLQDGEIDILTGNGKGTSYRIAGNSPASSSGVTTLRLYSPLQQQILAGTKVNLGYNLWYNLVTDIAANQSGSSTNKHFVGVSTTAIGANQYAWIQTNGRALVISDNNYWNGSTVTNGQIPQGFSLVPSKSNAGQVTGANPTTDADKQIVGYGLEAPYIAGAGVLFPADLSIG
jgi:hypothetical protein